MKRFEIYATICAVVAVISACKREISIPETFESTDELALLVPDYKNIACPYNIAPLNFKTANEGQKCIAEIKGMHATYITEADKRGMFSFDVKTWKALLASHKSDTLTFNLYIKRDKQWRRLRPFYIYVAPEPVDSFLTYRLIEPGYLSFRQMSICQRDLTSFDVKTLYDNHAQASDETNACVNCHNFQHYGTERAMLHVRVKNSGTVIYDKGKFSKVKFPTDSIPYGASYPAWHPSKPWIVFSSNLTGQSFHINHDEKVEVSDIASDLLFYDEKGTIQYVMRTDNVLETFPTWHPDGKRLYYTAASVPVLDSLPKEDNEAYIISHYKDLKYDIMYVNFDEETRAFGAPQKLLDCASEEKSASLPRVSPDGRYLLYTLADYGQFHIWHDTADLWICDLQADSLAAHPLKEANAYGPDSYHSWSSNGRWIAFSSRRDDGSYTRIYLTYFDRMGKAHKAFMIPQADPEQDIFLLKSYNVPELTRASCAFSEEALRQAIESPDAKEATYTPQKRIQP